MNIGLYKKGRTHSYPGDYSRQMKAACREKKTRNKQKAAFGRRLSLRLNRTLRKDEEFIINRKVRCDKSYKTDF